MIDVNLAIQFAGRSLHHRSKHAAIVFYNGEIIGIANNTKRYHAEERAYVQAYINKKFIPNLESISSYQFGRNLILISIAITKSGRLKLAKPCPECQKYLTARDILNKNIYYSTNAQTIVRMK